MTNQRWANYSQTTGERLASVRRNTLKELLKSFNTLQALLFYYLVFEDQKPKGSDEKSFEAKISKQKRPHDEYNCYGISLRAINKGTNVT